jgi:ATP/maltotriose-dependent transcriptional regulator MalT
MPRVPLHALRWRHAQGLYELSTQGQMARRFRPGDEAAWQSWLGEVTSVAFHGPTGSLNVYQEARPHGGQYWYAYHTEQGRTRKRYLGQTAQVTLARLEETAQTLSRSPAQASLPASPSVVPPSPGAESEPLLVTKLAPPRLPYALVERERLLTALEGALSMPLTLLSAAAGWGKTTLLASWASRHPHQIAWLSLDALDNELMRFWVSLIAALRRCRPGMGALALAMLRAPQPPPVSAILTALLNELAHDGDQQAPLLLLLDDYHLIDEAAIQESVTFWVEHLPTHVHFLLASRVDPDLPLARWRARGQLLELRAADLCFRPAEASALLQQTLDLSLADEEVAALQRRTEGWVAGLRLAALSLRQQEDPAAWIATFTGSQRYLLDYVHEEILQRQPESLQRFLLQVAVLTRLNAALCQAVTGEPEPQTCQAMLEALERSNLFVAPLDEQRQWYRLHDLFREALLARLQTSQPDLLPQVHRRAARWYAAAGELHEAIPHALSAHDFSYAAHLLARGAPSLWERGGAQTVLTWMQALPDPVLLQQARLALEAALRLLQALHDTVSASYARSLAQIERLLSRVEAALEQHAPPHEGRENGAPLGEAEVMVLKRRLRLLRALIATRGLLRRGDADALQRLAQEIVGLAEQEELSWQMIAFALTFWHIESLQREGARLLPQLLEFKARVQQVGDSLQTVRVREWLAFAYLRAGRLHLVEQECLEGLALVEQTGVSTAFEGYLHYHLALVFYAWNRLDEAAGALRQMCSIARAWQHADLLLSGHLALAQIALARGKLEAADQALHQADALIQQEQYVAHLPWAAALRVPYWLAAGDLAQAATWAEHAMFSPDTWNPNDRWPVLALVRVRLAQQHIPQALELLERFRRQLDRPGDVETAIHYLALSVVALHQAGKREQTQSALTRLLGLTEPEGNLRVYLDQGAPMRQALKACLAPHSRQHEQAPATAAYVSQVLAAFEDAEHGASRSLAPATPTAPTPAPVPISPALGAALTQREQEVLHLLAEGASNQEIAQILVISLDTVKKHVSNLLGKLGVASRTQAVAQARLRSLL